MKFAKYLLILQVVLTCWSCKEKTNKILLKDLKLDSIFGIKPKDSSHIYCLLGTGFLRTPRSANRDSLLKGWMERHPNAAVIPVSTLNEPDLKLTYCWLIDRRDTVNNYLIRNGCFPGGTMNRPQLYQEMSEKMKRAWPEKPDITLHVEQKPYDIFLEQIKLSEHYAKANKLGIWADEKMSSGY